MKKKNALIVVLLVFLAGLHSNRVFAQLTGWQYITPVTVYENSGAVLTDYNILLAFDTQTPIAAGKMKTDGGDIRFAEDVNGASLLNYWIESGINTLSTKVWVTVSSIPASDSVIIYMFYGNPSATTTGTVSSIFYAGLQALYTFTEGSGDTLYDKSGNYDLPLTGLTWQTGFRNNVSGLTGWTGGGRSFIPSNGPVLGTGDFTVLAFIYSNAPGPTQGIVGNYFDDSNNGWVVKLQGGDDFMLLTNEAGNWCQQGAGTITTAWIQAGAKRNSGISDYMYQNGNNILSLCPADNRNLNNSGPFEIGHSYNNQYAFDGNISFVAIYNIALSDVDIAKMYNSIFVSPEPTLSIGAENLISSLEVTNDTSICTGNSVNLTVTITDSAGFPAPYTFLWSPADSLSCTACQSPVANPTSTTTYMILVTDSSGAQDSAFVTVTIYSLPPVANAGPDTSMCEGGSIQLNATGGVYYSWSPSIGLSDTNIANPFANPTETTAYQVSVSNGCGSDVDSVTITVITPPVDAGADTSFCYGGSVNLEALGATSFVWSPATGLSCTACTKPTASPSVTTTYYVTGTDINGCINTDSIKVTVNGAPISAVSSTDTICLNDSVQLSVVACTSFSDDFESGAGNWVSTSLWHLETAQSNSPTTSWTYNTGSPNYNYDTGLNSGSLTSPVIDLTAVPPTDTTMLNFACFYETEDIGTFYDQRWIQVSANGGPFNDFLQLSGETMNSWHQHQIDISAFNGDNIQIRFFFNTIDGSINDFWGWSIDDIDIPLPCQSLDTTMNFTWAPSTGLSNPNIYNPIAGPQATTTYIVTVGDSSCFKTDTITVFVDNTIIVLTPEVGICTSDSVQLLATSNNSIVSWSWVPADSLSDTTIADPIANPSSTTTYTVTATNALGCQFTKNVTVSVAPPPVASFTHSESALTVAFTNVSVNADTWEWQFGDGFTSGLLNPTYTYGSAGIYNACLIVTNACSVNTFCELITVIDCQVPSAAFGYGISGPSVSFSDLSSNATGWAWDFGDGSAIDTNQNPSHTYSDTGTYNVCLTATNICSSDSYCNTISITSAVGVAENNLKNGINIYPNPNSGVFNLKMSEFENLKMAAIEIYNMLGKRVYQATNLQIIKLLNYQIDLSDHPAGIYNLQVITDRGISNNKIIIE